MSLLDLTIAERLHVIESTDLANVANRLDAASVNINMAVKKLREALDESRTETNRALLIESALFCLEHAARGISGKGEVT